MQVLITGGYGCIGSWIAKNLVERGDRVGRNTQGVRIMNLNEGDKIASIAKVAQEDEGEGPAEL
jgi:nucleoside-diphosphate-sugar epimerase